MTKGWHISRDDAQLILKRPANAQARWDVAARTTLPVTGRARLAHLIRQDMWRSLQRLRGFSPMVEVTRHCDHLEVRAGGTVQGAVPPRSQEQVQSVLDHAGNRRRWIGYACAMLAGMFIANSAQASGVDAGDLALPSGQQVTLQEIVATQGEVRFRFVAPDISRETGYLTYADVELDFQALCDEIALPWLTENAIQTPLIVVSLSEKQSVLGVASPDVTQFFEAFHAEGDRCIWEQF